MKNLNFSEYEAQVAMMTKNDIHYALLDIQKTLPIADQMDRETGSNDGGYYRDQASVLRRELAKR